jgi:hypothetical protein
MLAACKSGKTTSPTTVAFTQVTSIQPTNAVTTNPAKNLEKELLEETDNNTETFNSIENAILSKYLSRNFKEGYYTVVEPKTSLSISSYTDNVVIENYKTRIKESFKTQGYDVSELVDLLVELNISNPIHTLKSEPQKGYYIDYNGRIEKYFREIGFPNAWKQFGIDYPHARGICGVSLPAYDSKTDYVLIYFGSQGDWLAGSGGVRLLKYNNGEFIEIYHLPLWVS